MSFEKGRELNMKKILILSYYYKHKNAMASVRAIKLAKYFAKLGCDVTVLTSKQKDTWTKDYITPVYDDQITEIYAPEVKRWTQIKGYLEHRKKVGSTRLANQTQEAPRRVSAVKSAKQGLKTRLKAYLSWQFYFNVSKQEDICMFMGLKKAFQEEKLSKFDTVIATYPTYGAFLMGIWLKKYGYCTHLIADFRDPLYNPGFRNRKQETAYDLKCLRNILDAADRVVCVSKGIADSIYQAVPNFGKPVDVITNGFDSDDVAQTNLHVDFSPKKLHFVYTGTLYHGKRCVDMLAEILQELITERKIASGSFIFEYAGPDFSELVAQLKTYGMENAAVDHGFVSREESIAMQKAGDALLLLTWNEKTYQGVVPGKLFEYMAIGNVPIIALVTGDAANSEVSQIIRESKTGCACEAAVPDDLSEMKEYIIRLFNHEIKCIGNVEKYSYESICKEYIKIL